MFGSWREKLQTVQQDFSTGLRTLADSKDVKVKRKPRLEDVPQFSAGLELLSRYEENWVLLHRRSKDCGQTAETVDGEVVMLSAHWEQRRGALNDLEEQLTSLPDFTNQLDSVTARIAQLEGDFEEMESRLVYLEVLCCQCDQQKFKQHHMDQLETYKKKKRKELEQLKAELDSEHAQKVAELEQATQQKLKDRQKVYEEAFNQDMEKYLSTGYLQLTGPSVCVAALDQVLVPDVSDLEALDDFLNSTAEEDDLSHASSLTSGPDPDSWSSDSPRVSTTQAPPPDSPPANRDTAEVREEEEMASEGSDCPLVQSDEEDVQADASLVVLPEPGPMKNSDDSDSAGDQTPG